MKKRGWLVLGVLGAGIVACGGSGDDGASSANNAFSAPTEKSPSAPPAKAAPAPAAAPASSPPPPIKPGVYKLADDGRNGTVTVTSTPVVTGRDMIDIMAQPDSNSDLITSMRGGASYMGTGNTKGDFTEVDLRGDGESAPTGWIKTSSLETTGTTSHLDIEVQNTTGAMNEGTLDFIVDTENEVKPDGSVVSKLDDECTITAKINGAALSLTQQGPCNDSGLGHDVSVEGDYSP